MGERRAALSGALLAVVALLVAFQTTEASWLAYFWVHLGVLEGLGAAATAPRG